MGSYNQLSLLSDFDKYARRDFRLVDDLVRAIGNIKYLRTTVRFSSIEGREEIEEAFNQAIYWVAFLAFKKARFVEKYKGKNTLEDFLELTKEKSYVNITNQPEPTIMAENFKNNYRRMNTTFMAYKDLLKDERSITKRILDNLEQTRDLAQDAVQSTEG